MRTMQEPKMEIIYFDDTDVIATSGVIDYSSRFMTLNGFRNDDPATISYDGNTWTNDAAGQATRDSFLGGLLDYFGGISRSNATISSNSGNITLDEALEKDSNNDPWQIQGNYYWNSEKSLFERRK